VSEQRKKWLADSIAYIDKEISDNEEQASRNHLTGYDDTSNIYTEIKSKGLLAGGSQGGLFVILAGMFEDYLKGGKSTGNAVKVSQQTPPKDDPIKEADFYTHPWVYFKHHINWVSQPDYDKKVNWSALQRDFATWKDNENQIKDLLDQHKQLEIEVQQVAAQAKEEAAKGAAKMSGYRLSTTMNSADEDRRLLTEIEKLRAQLKEQADKFAAKIAELRKKMGEIRDKILQLASFRGRYGFGFEPEGIGIARVIVLTNQTAFDNCIPRFPYPFWKAVQVDTSGKPVGKGASIDGAGDVADTIRLLYVIGRGIPTKWSDPVNVVSDDPAIEYTVLAIEKDQGSGPGQKEAFQTGRKLAEQNLDADTKTIVDGLDAVLVRATLKRGVVPGLKDFRLSNIDASWVLRFADDLAEISFARELAKDVADPSMLRSDQVELTGNVFLPEQVYIEVRTEVAFPVNEVRLQVQATDKEVRWNPAPSATAASDLASMGYLTAKRVQDEPAGEIIEYHAVPEEPGRLVRKVMAVYRTPLIELYKQGEAVPPPKPGVYRLPVNQKDLLMAKLENHFLFRARPPLALATVYNDPSEIGFTWRTALTKAATADGYEMKDWNNLEGKRATDIANVIVTNIILPNPKRRGFAGWLRGVVNPLFSPVGFFDGGLTEKTTVTVGHHAALLLFKDAFLKQAQEGLDQLEKAVDQDDRWEVGGWMDAIKPFAWDESHDWKFKNGNDEVSAASSPWRYIRVRGPDGGDVPFAFALSDSYLEKTFGKGEEDQVRARVWAKTAGKEALIKYKDAIRFSIQKVKDTSDKDVAGLLKLLGIGYEAFMPHVLPRLVRLENAGLPNETWRPDLNSRNILLGLHTIVDAVRAQEEFSKLDTQFVLAMAFALTAPVLFGGGAAATVAAAAVEEFGANLGPALLEAVFMDIPDAVRQRNEIQFALGASLILGGDRLKEAEVSKTEWFEVGLKILGGYLQGKGPGMVLKEALTGIQRAVAWARTALILSKVRRLGIASLEKLSDRDFKSLMNFITEAKALEKTDRLMMTSQQRDASALADQLVSEARAEAKAQAKPSPAARPATEKPRVIADRGPGQAKASEESAEVAKPEDSPETIDPPDPDAPRPPAPSVPRARRYPSAPAPNSSWSTVDSNGKAVTYRLGDLRGEGGYAAVYDLLDAQGNPTGNVIKIFQKNYSVDIVASGREVITNTKNGSELLADTSDGKKAILQLPNKEYVLDAENPYFIQKKLDKSKMVTFDYKPTVKVADPANPGQFRDTWPLDRKSLAAFAKDEGLQRAVVQLFYDLKEKGLIWEDSHLGNIFFVKEGDRWVAGILDQDRIIKFTDRRGRLGLFFGLVETWPFIGDIQNARLKITSLRNAPKPNGYRNAWRQTQKFGLDGIFYPDAEFFMEKMFEWKDWIIFDSDENVFHQQFLKPEIVQEKFPRLYEDARNPPDLRRPNRKVSRAPREVQPWWVADSAAVIAMAKSLAPHRFFTALAIDPFDDRDEGARAKHRVKVRSKRPPSSTGLGRNFSRASRFDAQAA
jgi:hypothetical protein